MAQDITINNEVMDAIWNFSTSHNQFQEFELQLNEIDSVIKKFDTNNISISVTEPDPNILPIITDLNVEILGENYDNIQDSSNMGLLAPRKWKKIAYDPNPIDSHMQNIVSSKRTKDEGEETQPELPNKKCQVF